MKPAEVLEALVREDSVTGDTERAVAAFVKCAIALGLESYRDEAGNAVAIAGRGPREILLVGHIDTVAPSLSVKVKDGWVCGRGAVDAKGPLAAFLCAAARFGESSTHRLIIIGVCDEEGESRGARYLVNRYHPESLVIGEPSGTNGVTLGYKGIVKIRYEVEDDLQHTGAPHPSVPDRGLAFWHAIQMYLAQHHGDSMFEMPTVKLADFTTTLLSSGRVRVRLVGSARTPPGFDVPAFLEFIHERAGSGKLDVPDWAPDWHGEKKSILKRAFVAELS